MLHHVPRTTPACILAAAVSNAILLLRGTLLKTVPALEENPRDPYKSPKDASHVTGDDFTAAKS